MLERFTTEARAAVVRARAESIELGHPRIGTEHLLLALLQGDGPGARLLHAAGVEADDVRARLERAVEGPAPLLDQQDAEALRSIGIDLEAVMGRIEETFGPEALIQPSGRRAWFRRRNGGSRLGPRAKKVLELSVREAVSRQQGEISTAHLLLGLLREGQGLGARLLSEAGADLDDLRVRTEATLRRAA